jgi:uncharacterized protein (TIGR02099 family)
MTRLLRRLVKWFYLLIAMMLILLAILVQSGRSFSYLLGDYQDSIAGYLSKRIEAKVTIKKIEADWKGLKPGVLLRGVKLQSLEGEDIADMDRAMLRLDILRSLTHARLVWSDLSVEKIRLSFQQQDDGFWQIAGLTTNKSNTNNSTVATKIDPLIDMLLLSHHLSIKQSHLQFAFNNGQTLNLTAPKLLLENKNNFHRLSLQVDIENKPRSLFLLMEANGDPRDQHNLQAKAYLELNQFPTSEPLRAATAFLLSGQESHLNSEGEVSAKIWTETRDDQQGFNLTGKLNLQRLLLDIDERHLALDKFSADLSGHWLRDGKWHLGLQSITAMLANENIQNMNLIARSTGFKQAVQLRLDQLDLEKTHQLLDRAGILGNQRLQQVMQTLQPKGLLSNLEISFPYQDAKNWQLAANAKEVNVSPWQGVPGLTGVEGYIKLNAKGGYISIDSRDGFSMFYANVYTEPMTYDRMFGQVAWHLQKENNKVYVNSGALNFYQANEHTSGYMWLSMPWFKGTDNVDLNLQIGSKQLNVSQYKKYTPKTLSPKLLEWLEKSIGKDNSGQASNIGFVYRASLNIKEPYARSYQLAMDLQNTELLYHSDWPELKAMSGHLFIDNAKVQAEISSAKVFDTEIKQAKVQMNPKADMQGSLLTIKASLDGSASDGLRILREGALRRYLGNSMDSWFMFGNIQTALDLVVPLGTNNPESDAHQQVDIAIHSSGFEMQNLNLQMTDLTGHIAYNNKTGLLSDNLTAILFDQKVTAKLKTIRENGKNKTRVDLTGTVAIDDLAEWTRRPETLFFKGLLPYELSVELKHNNKVSGQELVANGILQSSSDFKNDAFAEVTLSSNLEGVSVDLPQPYGKKAKVKRPFSFKLWMQPDYSQIQATYDGKLDTLFRLQRGKNSRLLNANIALSEEAKFASDDGIHASEFLVSGFVSGFDLDAWKKTKSQYDLYQQRFASSVAEVPASNSDEIAGLPFRTAITLGVYQLGTVQFENLAVVATRSYQGWNLNLQNSKIAGDLLVPHDSQLPLNVQLQQLYLDSAKTDELLVTPSPGVTEKDQSKSGVDPRKLPLANISVGELFIDGEAWGKVGFEIKPNSQGALIDNIKGNIRGMEIGHHDVADRGAQLFWQITEKGQQSRFVGQLTTNNMAEVLRNWKKPEMVESQTASILIDVNWLSSPQNFHLVDIAGMIQLKLTEGRFHRDASAGDGLLRLMSVLNFDSLARRLRLDFTDLYKTGLAYDEISGKVSFDRGTMTFVDPLVVRSPSSDLQMAGTLNLREETVNARIVANLPVAGNLTFYAALATGLPAAAGVYLVSKLFKKQVNQVASVSYTMTGSWEKPKMKFDRLFESEDSLRKSVKQKDNDAEKQNSNNTGILESNPDLKTQPR